MQRVFLLALALAFAVAVPSDVAAHTPLHKPGGVISPAIRPNETWNRTFDAPAIFFYHCHPHPWMEGIITVDASAPENGTVEVRMAGANFKPATLVVRPGTIVSWVNDDNLTHFVVESQPPVPVEPPAAETPFPGPPLLLLCSALVALFAPRP
ncbi:MAG: hypothetical protein ACT4PT_08855 [Methanobacteriota archaeon]